MNQSFSSPSSLPALPSVGGSGNITLPSATPAPLHDIVGPLPFFPYTRGEVFIALAVLFLLLGGLILVVWKLRKKPSLTPREAAMKALSAMKASLMEGSDHEFGVIVSTLLRRYLGEVFFLAAPRQTTEEFLDSLRGHSRFTPLEQDSLGNFLKQSDLLKFASGKATQEDRLALITAAEHFVQGGEVA